MSTTTDLSDSERGQIAEILNRRANEIATFKAEYERNQYHFASVQLACSREIERLRRLASRVNPTEIEED